MPRDLVPSSLGKWNVSHYLAVAALVSIGVSLATVCFANQPVRPTAPLHSNASPDETFDHKGQQLELPERVTFNAHIRGIMSNTCFACHGPDEEDNESGLRLDSFEAAVDDGGAIEPGDADESMIYRRIVDADDPMPPAEFRHQLSDYEKALFKRWIEQGAKYEKHWAYTPVRRPDIPKTKFQPLAKNEIDAFIFAKLEQNGFSPAPLADKATLLRRLSLDLTGLPPTPQELADFEADDTTDAYEKQVDRLMASPHYGERMAAFWLDLVRFSDTVGYHGDQNQRIFPYRDFVIQSLNENQPFDEFTRDQLAGDLLTNPTTQQLTATGLIRLNMVTREGGAQPGEYLAKYTADRVRMLGTAWLGATTGCCECHNHKYDPFSIEDFYSLGAYFDDVRQWGVYTSYGYTPNPDLSGFNNDYPFPPEMRQESPSLLAQIRYLEMRWEAAAAKLIRDEATDSAKFKAWVNSLSQSPPTPDRWQVAKPNKINLPPNAYRQQEDGSILLKPTAKSGSAQIVAELQVERPTTIRSVRMEVLPDKEHGGKIGRAADGRFTADVSFVHQRKVESPEIEIRPRYVRIELPKKEHLSLAEVQVFNKQRKNIAVDGTARQSSVAYDGHAKLAIDGNTDGEYRKTYSTTHTDRLPNQWWEVDLGKPQKIEEIKIWNRTDNNFGPRLKGYRLVLLDEDHQPIFRQSPPYPNPSVSIKIPARASLAEIDPNLALGYAVTNRSNPGRYRSGRPPRYLSGAWRSGPIRWQVPDETKLPHVGVYNFDRPVELKPGESLVVKIDSKDVGKIRLATSPFTRVVAGRSAVTESLEQTLQLLQSGATWKTIQNQYRDAANALLAAYYFHLNPTSRQSDEVTKLRHAIADCRSGMSMTLVSQPLPKDKIVQSRVLPRGNWQDKSGKEVTPNTPHFLPGHVTDPDKRQSRLDLAAWITSPENPLTSRHYVNRVWDQFFGTGLSAQLDDLGNQGEWPSHPALLDWLASEFQSNWDRKKIIRKIVTSYTYRQKSAIDKAKYDADPYNRLLAHQSARRLEAEAVRDNALAIAGQLNTQWIGGPSVFPAQPAGHYGNLQFPNRTYVADTDGRQYRRGVYMHWQRTFLHPMLTNFDAPSRDECVAKRTQSNSPQQALTLLNDPVFVELSRAYAIRILRESKSNKFDDRLALAYRLALARSPAPKERAGLKKLFEAQQTYFEENPADAQAFLQRQPGVGSQAELPELAAWAQVCRVILNLHETITRY